jgi:hypothetical protein
MFVRLSIYIMMLYRNYYMERVVNKQCIRYNEIIIINENDYH